MTSNNEGIIIESILVLGMSFGSYFPEMNKRPFKRTEQEAFAIKAMTM